MNNQGATPSQSRAARRSTTVESNDKIRVFFESTRKSERKEVMVGPGVTGQKAIDGLIAQKYLEPTTGQRNYALSHKETQEQIAASDRLVAKGVKDGDTVVVTEINVGAAEGDGNAPALR
jgi:hypothetical protein